jgi:hypothetical protein
VTDDSTLDDLELELRMLPGVRAAGFDQEDDVLFVQLHVTGDPEFQADTLSATRIAARHADRSVAVEVAHWRTMPSPRLAHDEHFDRADVTDVTNVTDFVDLGSDIALAPEFATPASFPMTRVALTETSNYNGRPRLLAVLSFPDTDELEVHLIHDGRRTIGRAPASRGLVGAAEATIDAIRALGAAITPTAQWARVLESDGDNREVVAVAVTPDDTVPTVNYGCAAGISAIDAAARSTLDALNRQLARALD